MTHALKAGLTGEGILVSQGVDCLQQISTCCHLFAWQPSTIPLLDVGEPSLAS